MSNKSFDWQGHRGARGNFPENTWPAFKFAMEQSVNTLEMDVVITKDNQVVISHEPFLSHIICLDSTGNPISEEEEKEFNIYQMTYEELKAFDCGTANHPRFLKQQHVSTSKPLLLEVINKVKDHARQNKLTLPYLNVEIKYLKENQGIFHPDIATYSKLVYSVLNDNYPNELWNIQSFDFDVLKYWHNQYPEVPLAALIEDSLNWKSHIAYLGFTPQIYSPYYILLNKKLVDEIHDANMKIIPWTVNDPKEAKKLIDLGVDGIITDYPEMAKEFKDIQ